MLDNTDKFGLLGYPLGHSYSPLIQDMFGIKDYKLYPTPDEEFDEFMEKADFKGINVTIPYKKRVFPYCQILSPIAQRLGSVNTITKVLCPDGVTRLRGHNTDYDGFKYLVIKSGFNIKGSKIILLGNGGTSVTAKAVLEDMGAGEIINVSRKGPINYDNITSYNDGTVLVNATPVGMFPKIDETPLDPSIFPNLEGVIDVIFNPSETLLMKMARDKGIKAIGGLAMLVAQAKYAAEAFAGKPIDDGQILQVLNKVESIYNS